MRLVLIAFALLNCVGGHVNARSLTPASEPIATPATANCPNGEYTRYTVTMGKNGPEEHSEGSCFIKDSDVPAIRCPYGEYEKDTITSDLKKSSVSRIPKGSCLPNTENPVIDAEIDYINNRIDYEKMIMDEYGITRREVRKWFSNGGDTAEMPLQQATHSPESLKVIQVMEKVLNSKGISEIRKIIGLTKIEPDSYSNTSCFLPNRTKDSVHFDIMSVSYNLHPYYLIYKIEHSCEDDSIIIEGSLAYRDTCVDYTDFNEAFESIGIRGRSPLFVGFGSEIPLNVDEQPYVFSKKGPVAYMRNHYIYPNYKTSKSCIYKIETKFNFEYKPK